MAVVLNARAVGQFCSFGCCAEVKLYNPVDRRKHRRVVRAREKRAWKRDLRGAC